MSSYVAIAVFLVAVPPSPPTGSQPTQYWVDARPEGPEEAAVAAVLARAGSDPPARARELEQVAAQLSASGAPAAALARLEAGLTLVDAGRPVEAVPLLVDADVQKSLLYEYSLLGLGRAQEGLQQWTAAAQAYLAAAGGAPPRTAVACVGLMAAAEAFDKAKDSTRSADAFARAVALCPSAAPLALRRQAEVVEGSGAMKLAAETYDRLDRDFPLSAEARDTAPRRRALAAYLPPVPAADRAARELRRGETLLAANRFTDAAATLQGVDLRLLPAGEPDHARVMRARALLALHRSRDAAAVLAPISAASPYAAEADLQRARIRAERGGAVAAFTGVADAHKGTPSGEDALVSLANYYVKDGLHDQALPYLRRILVEYPDGVQAVRAAWRTGLADYRARRFDSAATIFERAARTGPASPLSPGLLYGAGRSWVAAGDAVRGRDLLEETVRRYKHAYYGLLARAALSRLPNPVIAASAPAEPALADIREEIKDPDYTRIHQLLLLGRREDAERELRALPPTPRVQASIAWIEQKSGRLRPGITAMKRALPEYIGEAGDRLPAEVWHILFPIRFRDEIVAAAASEGVDPALLAALVCQESSFEPAAISRAGARGLTQVMPATGRKLAREMGVRFAKQALHDPDTSLDYGTRYLRQALEREGGRVERALAAYNAGPHRVAAWTAWDPNVNAEDFVEDIPFTETRIYVMTILASREHYRRLYGLAPATTPAAPNSGARP